MALFKRKNKKEKTNDLEARQQQTMEEIKDLTPAVKEAEVDAETSQDELMPDENATKKKTGLFDKFKIGLSKTRSNLSGKINELIQSSKKLDEEFWEELEEILIQADVGVNTSLELVAKVKQTARKKKISDSSEVMSIIADEVRDMLNYEDLELNLRSDTPSIIMVVGVNGAGKTTTIAKLAYKFKNEQQRVILAAADTFRAAAIDQLQIWADRVGVELIKHQEGADPGAVVFDAISAAKARKADVLIIDTAGRLQNKTNLMKEISKIRKIIEREVPAGPQEVLLVLDATTGQNAISQARIFEEATGVTGIVLTKLDGTAKGGIVLGIASELKIPVKFVGIGEGMDDMKAFDPEVFARALFEE
ncbi:signal recognition particle receptor protein ftsy (alpha subunit) [hydrocarbon metagenome]|uniref:Signal recognition particle receptor protein ftsy (Alpha subunit) n=1 Tax=hydrocarbon metagenome TaxID=938273 RepID=A0A0W8E345_9ZZZZ